MNTPRNRRLVPNRRTSLAAVLGITASLLVALPGTAAADPTPTSSPTPGPLQTTPSPTGRKNRPADKAVTTALEKARTSGKRVEIPQHHSETTTLYANPDGKTLRMELSIKPVRVKKADGTGFTPIDTTLVEADGAITPKAAQGTLRLSTGGNTTLLTSKAEAGTARLAAPGKLPKPRLKGNTATYPSAYGDGTDLVVTATATGFRQQIVLRKRPSGPVTFRVQVDLPDGMSFGTDAANRPVVLGSDGQKISDLRPAPLLDANVTSDDGDFEAGKIGKAPVSVDVADSALIYTPDTAFLADPAVVYPVTLAAVEPDWWEPDENATVDTFVNDVDYTTSVNSQFLDQILVGKSYAGGVAKRWRSYLRFEDIPADSPLRGATVQNADLVLWNHLSNDCGNVVGSGITVRRITSNWSSNTMTWNNQPSTTSAGAYTNYSAYSPDCTSTQWAAKEWDLVYSIDDIVQAWADGAPNYGLRLTAGNESELRNWRRYRTTDYRMCYAGKDCEGRPHQPLLFVDFEPPDPPHTETVVTTSRDPLPSIPEYEEALARSVYVPEPGESITPLSDAIIAANEDQRDGEGYFIGTDKLSPRVPDPGDSDDTSNPEGEDTTPPRVLATEPVDNATDVPLDSPIRVTFTEEIFDPQFVVKSAQGAPVQGTTTLDDSEKIATFTPAQPLRPGTTYTVEVSGGIDPWENEMAPYTWSFQTIDQAAARWTFDEGDGRTAADSSGNDHDAILNDTAAWIPGKSGTAISNTPAQAQTAAARQAVSQGKAVEVVDQTTETSITHAQPDGKTFVTQIAAGPVRTKQGGTWVPIDTTLVEQGGVLRPKALASGVSVGVSTGGTNPFVKMTSADGRTYALQWPTPLPKPTVSKNVATFADAAGPGADLVVTVLPTGFRHDVVLRRRPAKPLEIRIGVQTDGLTLAEGKGGRLLLTGKDKKPVASAPQPVMVETAENGRVAKAERMKIDTEVVNKGGRTELVLRPDPAFLSDPATTYPVRVDPTITLPLNHDVDVYTGNDAGWPADPTSPYLLAGKLLGETSRVHLRFDTSGLVGATVTDAKLSLLSIDSHACGATAGAGIQVRRVTSAWNENFLHWGNKPATTTEDAQTNRAGYGEVCSGGAAPMQWTITGIVQDWAAGAANHGLALMHPNESNSADNYRVFTSSEDFFGYDSPPTLTVTTGPPPSSPSVTGLSITPAQSVSGTVVVGSLTPQLAATVTDTAGGGLRGEFELEHDPAAPAEQGTGQIWTGAVDNVASGAQASVTVPAGKLADGWQVRWRARAANPGASTTSAWSNWQSVTIDVPNPTVDQLQTVPSTVTGGVAVATSLTPALLVTVTDPAGQALRAEYELEHDPDAPAGQGSGQIWTGAVDNVASGTQASITVPADTLSDGWKVRWRARAVNPATTIGSPWSSWQRLTVDLPDVPSEPAVGALQVTPSEQVEDTTIVSSRTPALLVQVSDPAGGTLRAEYELEHDPDAPAGQGSGQIWTGAVDNVASGTQASITVPADTLSDGWKVRWRARATSPTAQSAWSEWQPFTIALPAPTVTGLTITPSAVVDGTTVVRSLTPTLQAALAHPTEPVLRAEFEVEHAPDAPAGQGTGQIWTGTVDDVASGATAALTIPEGTLTDGWKIRWRLRALVGDTSSAWSDWQEVTIDVIQPGEEPLAQTTQPVIHTDQSFTVAAWLRWSDKNGDYTVLEQRGTHQAPFRLGNDPEHGLVFTFTNADAADTTVEGVLSGVEPPVDEWFHLTGTYDATTRTATLYLNGTQVGNAQLPFPTWDAQAPLRIGAAMAGGIDEVHIYQRPLNAGEVSGAIASAPALAPAPATASTLQQKAASISAAAQTGNFTYDRINLQDCQVSPSETGYAEYDARIRELPYNSCWSAYLQMQDYEEDDRTGRMRKSTCKSIRKGILKWLCSQLEEPFDEDYALRFRATVVIHSYLGNSTGTGVVGGEGTGIKPTDMKVFIQLDDFAVVDEDGRVVLRGNQLSDLPLATRVYIHDRPFTDEGCATRDGEKKKDISTWQSSSYDVFNVRTTIDHPGVVTCALHPEVVFYTDLGLEWFYLPLFSQKVIDVQGRWVGVLRKGDDKPSGWKRWMPHFRCDSLRFGAYDPEVEDRVGGCINTRSKRVFIMSTRSGTEFPEVAQHIKDALNPATNKNTYPPKRAGEFEVPNPPIRAVLGTELPKRIPGNWAAPVGSDAGEPLHRTTDEIRKNSNRLVFSRRGFISEPGTPNEKEWPDNPGSNYCKYYQWEKYIAQTKFSDLHCDEYPFASTLEGAASTEWDFSIRAVSAKQNIDQGNALGRFYADFRVGNGNSFWVMIE